MNAEGRKMKAPYISIKYDGKCYPALIDTGASASIIADSMVKEKLGIKPTKVKLKDASGTPIVIIGTVEAEITTTDGKFFEHLLVSKDSLNTGLIIGMNILRRAEINLPKRRIKFVGTKQDVGPENMERIKMEIESELLKDNYQESHLGLINPNTKEEAQLESAKKTEEEAVKERSPEEPNLHLLEDLLLPNNALVLCPIKISKRIATEGETVITHHQEHKNRIIIANSISRVRNGQILLNVINLNDHEVRLQQGTRLSQTQRLVDKEEDLICTLSDEGKRQQRTKQKLKPLTEEDINCGDQQQKDKLLTLLNRFRNICWLPGESLGRFRGDPLSIDLKEDTVVNKAPYRIPHSQQGKLKEVIKDLEKNGVIARSKSVFNSPLIIVPKPDGSIRPCIDYRALNALTRPITYPIPKISELLNNLNQINVMSSIDLVAAYHQCDIRPQDREKTAFTVGNSKYEFHRVPFGLTSAPGYFSRVINETLFDLLEEGVVAYMDDILIFSKDKETQLNKLEKVLKKLDQANLKLKVKKCEFFTDKITFLGFTLTPQGLSMDPTRCDSLRKLKNPTNKRELQAFLGACNYFRMFVKHFSEISEPLYELLRKNVPFKWTDRQSKAVEELKEKLCTAPILKLPDWNKVFHLYSDASGSAIGACLMQPYETNGQIMLHPVSFLSKSLNQAQRNYSTTKREALGLLYALEQYRQIILHYPIQVYTDHYPLLGILTKTTKDACLTRWSLLMQEYSIDLRFLPGKQNIFSDVLSRLADVEDKCETFPEELEKKLVNKINTIQEKEPTETSQEGGEENCLSSYIPPKIPWTETQLKDHQKMDKKCEELKTTIKNSCQETTTKLTKFKILKDIIYVLRKIERGPVTETYLVPFIPDSLMDQALKLVHDDTTAGHKGFERTLKAFVKNFYNHQESIYIKRYCEACEVCLKAKSSPKSVAIHKYPIPAKPMTTLGSDILGPLPITEKGNRYILTFRDYTSRYSLMMPLKNKEADTILDSLRQVISIFGPPETLLTDNAKEYISDKVSRFCVFYNIKKVEVVPYHPQSAGLSERINREILKLIRIYTNTLAVNDWDQLIPVIQLTLNNCYNATLGETPFYVLFGFDSPTITLTQPKFSYNQSDLAIQLNRVREIRKHCRENILRIQDKYTDRTNQGRKEKPIKLGDRVYAKLNKHIKTAKLDLPISGPFIVTSVKGSRITIESITSKETYDIHPDSIVPSNMYLDTLADETKYDNNIIQGRLDTNLE